MKGRTRIPDGWKQDEEEQSVNETKVIDEPDFVYEPSLPKPPDYLIGEALQEWERIIDEIPDANLLSPCDQGVLAGYCKTFAQYRELCDTLDREGMTYRVGGVDPMGVFRPIKILAHPAVALSQMCLGRMCNIAKQFGFTPYGRKALDVQRKKEPKEVASVDTKPKRAPLLNFINGHNN